MAGLTEMEGGCFHDWSWNSNDKSHEIFLSGRRNEHVKFHPSWSVGTAAVRGTKPLTRGCKTLWEISLKQPFYGTSIMFGVGTKRARIHADSFLNLLGEDGESMGLSHKGLIWQKGVANKGTGRFDFFVSSLNSAKWDGPPVNVSGRSLRWARISLLAICRGHSTWFPWKPHQWHANNLQTISCVASGRHPIRRTLEERDSLFSASNKTQEPSAGHRWDTKHATEESGSLTGPWSAEWHACLSASRQPAAVSSEMRESTTRTVVLFVPRMGAGGTFIPTTNSTWFCDFTKARGSPSTASSFAS